MREKSMAIRSVTKWALIVNMAVDLMLVVSPARRQKNVGKIFGASTAVGHAFCVHALVRGMAGVYVDNFQLRRAAFFSLFIELYYVLTSGKALKSMRPMLVVLAVMLGITASSLGWKKKKKQLK
jgi:hypothetical protein